MMSRTLVRVFCELYPTGPTDGRVWQRAGGDVSTLELGGTGRSMWHGAIEKARQGASPPLAKLLEVALEDFPANPTLLALAKDTSGSSGEPFVGQDLAWGPRRVRRLRRVALLTGGVLALGTTAFVLAFPSEPGAAVEPRGDSLVSAALPAGAPAARPADSVAPVRPPSPRQPAAGSSPPAAKASRPSPERGGAPEDEVPPLPPRVKIREPEPASYAFASQSLAEAEADFRRGEYLLSLRRISTTSERLALLEQRFPDSRALRSIRGDLSSLSAKVRAACEEDARVRRVAPQCT